MHYKPLWTTIISIMYHGVLIRLGYEFYHLELMSNKIEVENKGEPKSLVCPRTMFNMLVNEVICLL